LEIIPVLNKVDLPSANPEEVSDDIVDLGCKLEDIIHASGKTGLGVIFWLLLSKEFRLKGNVDEPLQALIFDSTTIHFVELKLFSV
jgi:GTP-binding protein LepA